MKNEAMFKKVAPTALYLVAYSNQGAIIPTSCFKGQQVQLKSSIANESNGKEKGTVAVKLSVDELIAEIRMRYMAQVQECQSSLLLSASS